WTVVLCRGRAGAQSKPSKPGPDRSAVQSSKVRNECENAYQPGRRADAQQQDWSHHSQKHAAFRPSRIHAGRSHAELCFIKHYSAEPAAELNRADLFTSRARQLTGTKQRIQPANWNSASSRDPGKLRWIGSHGEQLNHATNQSEPAIQ